MLRGVVEELFYVWDFKFAVKERVGNEPRGTSGESEEFVLKYLKYVEGEHHMELENVDHELYTRGT